MTIDEAVRYIKCVSSLGTKPGLERIKALLYVLGNPERNLRVIHVAGTNGKGSFCAMLSSVLRESGHSVAVYTSPHLIKYNERFSFNGSDISDSELSRLLDKVIDASSRINPSVGKPSEFELLTAAMYLWCGELRPDFCVIECGMGGRWDATNVIDRPILSVITGVALDHTAYLGDTVEKIACEKAGIIKPGCPVLFGGTDPTALGVISKFASDLSAELHVTRRELIDKVEYGMNGTSFSFSGDDFFVHLPGHYQPYNAANVIEAAEILRSEGVEIPDNALKRGLELTKWAGRFERLSEDPQVYFDGGHNPDGVDEAVESVHKVFRSKVNLISGMLSDKDYRRMAWQLAGVADCVFTIRPDSPRALGYNELADVFRSFGVSATPCRYMKTALRRAIAESEMNGLPVLCVGSLYSYAPFRKALEDLLEQKKGKNGQR